MEFVALFVVIVAAIVVGNLISAHPKVIGRILKVVAAIMVLIVGAAICFYLSEKTEFFGRLLIAGAYVVVMSFLGVLAIWHEKHHHAFAKPLNLQDYW